MSKKKTIVNEIKSPDDAAGIIIQSLVVIKDKETGKIIIKKGS